MLHIITLPGLTKCTCNLHLYALPVQATVLRVRTTMIEPSEQKEVPHNLKICFVKALA